VNALEATPNQQKDCLPRRVRITFRKGEIVKYISNLDLLRAWERILRRARLPLAYTQGFNPHPRITIAMPLAVGCSGENEVLDVLLEVEDGDGPDLARTVRHALEPAMPPGISVVSVVEVPRRDPALATQFAHARYRIALEGIERAVVESRITELMGKSEVPIQFRRKTFDLRPLVGSLALLPKSSEEPDIIRLDAVLLRDERGRTGRPDALVQALELEPYVRQMVRQELVFEV
jgi:radical SAM-linked protein